MLFQTKAQSLIELRRLTIGRARLVILAAFRYDAKIKPSGVYFARQPDPHQFYILLSFAGLKASYILDDLTPANLAHVVSNLTGQIKEKAEEAHRPTQ